MSAPTEYQWVVTASNYDSDPKFPRFVRFDGVDDYLNLPYMGLYANGSASVIMVRTDFQNANGCVYIGESNSGNDTPVYWLGAKISNNGYGTFIRNDAGIVVVDSRSNTGLFNIGPVVSSLVESPSSVIRKYVNTQLANTTGYARVGTLTLHNTVFGARVRTTTGGYINANIYGLIITKSALTDAQRIACERHLSRKSGVTL